MSPAKALIFKPCQNRIIYYSWNRHLNNPPSPSTVRTLISSTSSHHPQNEPITKTPLHLLFQEAVGLVSPGTAADPTTASHSQTNQIKIKLLELEQELRALREAAGARGSQKQYKSPRTRKTNAELEKPNSTSLYALFTDKSGEKNRRSTREEEPKVFKELSPGMEMFLTHLYRLGYLREANFLRDGRLDFSCFNDSYSRSFIKFATEKFGQDHQDIAIWLSGRDLKKVALFGCPSLSKKSVFSAKTLRKYFKIQEDTVCGRCVLKESCAFANQGVRDTKILNLAAVMRVIILYALEGVNLKLSVPDEIKDAVCRLLGEVTRLTSSA